MLWTFIQSITQPGSVSLDDIMTSQAKPSKKKRKAGEDEDEDDDYKPSPIKTLGSAAKTRSKATKR